LGLKRNLKKAALIYNPISGEKNERRLAQVEAAAQVLRQGGIETCVLASTGPRSAGQQARAQVEAGCDAIFACGGDGTIHDVLQGMVFSPAVLAIIPMGTANALAHDLRIPRHPAAAAHAALTAEPRRIAVGHVAYRDGAGESTSRYFTVALGAGVDAHLFYRLQAAMKHRMGMNAYYAKAFQLWLTHDLAPFEVEFVDLRSGLTRKETVTQVLAVRITQFGGVLRKLAPGAALQRNDLRIILFKTKSRMPYLLYLMRAMLNADFPVPGVELVNAAKLLCRPVAHANAAKKSRIYAEADGELLATIPIEVTMVPSALTVLVPQTLATEKVRDHLMATAAPPMPRPVS
jgi:diacylglycerol kinase (ATP)